MTDKLYSEEKLRDFLLGDLSESERAAIEDRFLADEDFSAQLQVVEDELIENYLRAELSAADRKRFEAAFLTQPRRRERVVAMQGVLAAANAEAPLQSPLRAEQSPSPWASVGAFFRFQSAFARYAFAAAAVFVLAFGALLLFNRLVPKQGEPLAQQNPTPLPSRATASPSPHPSPNISQAPQTPAPAVTPSPQVSPIPPIPRSSPSPTEAPPAGPTFATIVLRPSLVRDPAAASKLTVEPSVKQIQLLLKLERNEYKSYAVRLTRVDGHLVWQARSVHARTTTGRTSLAVAVPVRLLPTDDYLVEVSGVNDAAPPESLASYFFSVTRK